MGEFKFSGNFAYIDNQNMYVATHCDPDSPWDVDMRRFRVYLREKFNVANAYLFMGAFYESRIDMYRRFKDCGYILMFRENGSTLKGEKKGNVDTDIVFEVMRDLSYSAQLDKVVLVSGDGDYFKLVSHMFYNKRLEKLILPSSKSASSLYKALPESAKMVMDSKGVKGKLMRKGNGAFA